MSRSVDFQFTINHQFRGEMRVMGYVTGSGEFRLSDIWGDYPLHYGFEFRKGQFLPRRAWAGVYDECPRWLAGYVNTPEFHQAAAKEMKRIASRFEKAADKAQRQQPDDAQESEGQG